MPKARTVYFCSACGFESPRWLGRCPQCEAWNSFDERPMRVVATRAPASAARSAGGPAPLDDVDDERLARTNTGLTEFDTVLGGGIVAGSLTLIGGPPGAGKSTLLLQIAAMLPESPIVYVCGEESAAQVKLRAARLNLPNVSGLLVYPETNLREVLDRVEKIAPKALIVDSIQTVWLPESESYAGSVTQVRDCTQALMEFAKRTGCPTFIVGHVTKEGTIAGPRLLEHLVDTVLYFEGEANGDYRIVRAYKNRFGSVDEICVFTMHSDGLHEVRNPSELFLSGRGGKPSGSCVVASIVGSRPVLIEVQALVGETSYGTPRRLANNIDQARLAMIIAVLERRAGLHLGAHDIYASVAGGLRISEPAADLGIALAIASSFRDRPLAPDAAAFGELGLSGEVRAVNASGRRSAEARKLGYRTLYTPENVQDIARAIEASLG
ncbi:MAG TPA: DNA repair protein RadA [Candidatus Baltobacteraceae bacterium]|jgi:DNA repair protein RadA/Sms|nr:DNA repair protein RadA [Candidatus Baltobacteraceae bacterium]